MKVAIVYQSVHHHNTEKVVKAMAEVEGVDVFSVSEAKGADLSGYDYIGIASGIYAATLHRAVLDFFGDFTLGANQKFFIVFTCTAHYANFEGRAIKMLGYDKDKYLGSFWCKGYNTFGPFGWFGGAAKNHPNDDDLAKAKEYIKGLVK